MKKCGMRATITRCFAVALGAVVLTADASGASFAAEFAQTATLEKAENWKASLELNMGLLSTRLKDMSDEDAVRCYLSTERACRALGDRESCVKCFGLFRKRAGAVPGGYTDTSYYYATCNYMELGMAEETVTALAEADKIGGMPENVKVNCKLLAVAALSKLGRKDEARAILLALLDDPNAASAMDSLNTIACVQAAVEEAGAKGDWAGTARRCLKAMLACLDRRGLADGDETAFLVALRRDILPKITDAKARCELADFAATLIPASVSSPMKCFEFQKVIVILYNEAQRSAEADVAIKTLWETCPAACFDSTVGYLSNLIKARDGSLARANRFLEYVKTGTVGADGKAGTEDDIAYPFADSAVKRSAAVEAAYATAETALLEDRTWQGQHALSCLYRYWGKQKQALQALQRAFNLAPMDPQPLQLIAGDMVNVLIQVSGDPAKGDILSDFLKYGKEGKDGKPGTGDDIADPLAPFLKG